MPRVHHHIHAGPPFRHLLSQLYRSSLSNWVLSSAAGTRDCRFAEPANNRFHLVAAIVSQSTSDKIRSRRADLSGGDTSSRQDGYKPDGAGHRVGSMPAGSVGTICVGAGSCSSFGWQGQRCSGAMSDSDDSDVMQQPEMTLQGCVSQATCNDT